jgi:uncharacterized protein YijF (DUF1287 family)
LGVEGWGLIQYGKINALHLICQMLCKTILPVIIFLCSACSYSQDRFFLRLADSTVQLTKISVTYDPAYVKINYPGGDVPAHTGVCTDVVIRAYRKLGIDLQSDVHVDMKNNFQQYPKNWGRPSP